MAESFKAFREERSDHAMNISRLFGEYLVPVVFAIVDYAMIVLALLTAWQLRSVWLQKKNSCFTAICY